MKDIHYRSVRNYLFYVHLKQDQYKFPSTFDPGVTMAKNMKKQDKDQKQQQDKSQKQQQDKNQKQQQDKGQK